jgi:VCBS repeat-containing protein
MATSPSPVTAATNTVAKGTVVFVQGEAYLRDSSGKLSAIKPGDVVTEGQEIVTRNGAVVELQLPSGAKISVGPNRELLLNDEFFATATPERSENAISSLGADADKVIQALNAGKDPFEDLEDPAAGLTGGSLGDQTHDFVRLVRVLEEVTPVAYNYATTADGVEFLPAAAITINTPPVASDDSVSGTEDQAMVMDVLANDSDANNDPLMVTNASATNGQVTINPDGSLRYVPNPDFNGVDTVTYTISDGKGGTATATVTINVTPVADAAVLGIGSGAVKEDVPAESSTSGTLTITDADTGEAVFQPQTATSGTYGNFNVDADGAWTYSIDNTKPAVQAMKEGESRAESFTVRSVDGTTTTVSITIIGTNDGPVANSDVTTSSEDQPVTVNVLVNDTDPDGDTLTVTGATVDSTKGSVTYTPEGTLTFTPASNFNGPVEITYTISDGKGGTATATVTINVTPVADAAVLGIGSGAVKEDVPAESSTSGTLTITDADTGEAVFQPQTATSGTYGNFNVDADGAWTYSIDNTKPAVQAMKEGESRAESFTVRSVDGTTTTVSITIIGTNDGPVANSDTATTPEDQPITVNVLGNDTDPDGDALSVTSAIVDASQGTVVVNADGTLTFNPAANTIGPVVISYTISDSKGGTASSTVTIDITPVASPAELGTGSGFVKEDVPNQSTTSGALTIIDADAGEAAFQPQTGTAGTYGSFSIDAAGNWTFSLDNSSPLVQNLAEGESRTDTFTVSSIDGTTSTVVVTILGTDDGANTLPVANPDTATTEEELPVTLNVLGNDTDPDGDTLTLTDASVDPAKGSVTFTPDGTLTFNPAANVNGQVVVTYTIADHQGGSATSTVTIDVNPVNDAPLAQDDADSLARTDANPATGNVITNPAGLDTDIDGGPLTISQIGSTPVTGATVANGAFGTLTIHPDGNYSYSQDSANSAVAGLAPGASLIDSFTYTVSDGQGGTDTAQLRITISGANDGPVANPDTATTPEEQPVTINVLGNDTDPDGDTLTLTNASVDPAKGSVTFTPDGTLTFNPAANVNGQVVVTYTIADHQGGSATSTVTIDVNPVNDAPLAQDDADSLARTDANPATGNVITNPAGLDTDIDGGPLTISQIGSTPVTGATVANGAFGTLTIHPDGNYSYSQDSANSAVAGLAPGASLIDSFTYTVSDGQGGTDTAQLRITISGANDGPVANPDTATTPEEQPVTINVLGNDTDPDGDTLTLTNASVDPAKGSVTFTPDGTLTFNPAANVNGQVVVTYTIADHQGGSATSTVTIDVNPVNDAPLAQDDADSLARTDANPATGNVITNPAGLDTDIDGGPLTISQIGSTPVTGATVANGAFGTLTIHPDGNYSYSQDSANSAVAGLAPGASLIDSFTYTVSDGQGGTDTAQLRITISGANDGPVANPDTATTPEEQPVTINVLGNDTDPDGDTLTLTNASVDPAKGSVTFTPDGTLTFNPAANVNGQVVVTYTIADHQGGSATSTVTIDVNPVNDAPVAVNDSASTSEDSPVSRTAALGVLANDNDIDSTGLSVSGVRVGTSGAFAAPGASGITLTGTYGSLLIRADGSYTYTPGAAAQALNTGASVQDVFSYQLSDGSLTAVANLSINVTGTTTHRLSAPPP